MYIANQTDAFSLNGKVGLAQTSPFHFEMVSLGGSPNLEVHGLFHITVNANGTVTTFINNLSVSCK